MIQRCLISTFLVIFCLAAQVSSGDFEDQCEEENQKYIEENNQLKEEISLLSEKCSQGDEDQTTMLSESLVSKMHKLSNNDTQSCGKINNMMGCEKAESDFLHFKKVIEESNSKQMQLQKFVGKLLKFIKEKMKHLGEASNPDEGDDGENTTDDDDTIEEEEEIPEEVLSDEDDDDSTNDYFSKDVDDDFKENADDDDDDELAHDETDDFKENSDITTNDSTDNVVEDFKQSNSDDADFDDDEDDDFHEIADVAHDEYNDNDGGGMQDCQNELKKFQETCQSEVNYLKKEIRKQKFMRKIPQCHKSSLVRKLSEELYALSDEMDNKDKSIGKLGKSILRLNNEEVKMEKAKHDSDIESYELKEEVEELRSLYEVEEMGLKDFWFSLILI